MSIINEELAWVLLIALMSAGIFYLIFLFHVINGNRKAGKENITLKQTLSYGYIAGGVILFGLQSICLFCLSISNGMIQDIVAVILLAVLFLSPVIILLSGWYYNRIKKL